MEASSLQSTWFLYVLDNMNGVKFTKTKKRNADKDVGVVIPHKKLVGVYIVSGTLKIRMVVS